MPTSEEQVAALAAEVAGLAVQAGVLSVLVSATLAVANQNIPDFKKRALATLDQAITILPAHFVGRPDPQVVVEMAANILNGLDGAAKDRAFKL